MGGRSVRGALPLLVTAVALAAASPAAAQSGPIRIEGAFARAAQAGEDVAAYLTIVNTAWEKAVLTGCSADGASSCVITEPVIEAQDGGPAARRLRPAVGLVIPPDSRMVFEPGGHTFLLVGLRDGAGPGDEVDLALTFGAGPNARAVRARARVPVLRAGVAGPPPPLATGRDGAAPNAEGVLEGSAGTYGGAGHGGSHGEAPHGGAR